jgi:hypothetical protein
MASDSITWCAVSWHTHLHGFRLYYLVCCFLAQTGAQSSVLFPNYMTYTFTLKCRLNQCLCIGRTHGSHCSMGNKRCKPRGLVPHTSSSCCTTLPEACASKQAQGLLLPAGLGASSLQQLPWLLETHTPTQVDPMASAALWTPDDSSLLALLPPRNPQFATQCQEPAATHTSEP